MGVGHEGAAPLLAHHQALALQLADGLAHRAAGNVERAAELRLAGEQRARAQRAGGNIPLYNAHELGIQRDIAVHRELAHQNGVGIHVSSLGPGRAKSRSRQLVITSGMSLSLYPTDASFTSPFPMGNLRAFAAGGGYFFTKSTINTSAGAAARACARRRGGISRAGRAAARGPSRRAGG